MSVAIEFKVVEQESAETNSYDKSFGAIRMVLTDEERKWVQSVIDKYDQQSFKDFKGFGDRYIAVEGVYRFQLFQHKKRITIQRLAMTTGQVQQSASMADSIARDIGSIFK